GSVTRSSGSRRKALNSSSGVDFPLCCGSQTRAPKNRRGSRRFLQILTSLRYKRCGCIFWGQYQDAPQGSDVAGRIGIWRLRFLWCLEVGVWCFDSHARVPLQPEFLSVLLAGDEHRAVGNLRPEQCLLVSAVGERQGDLAAFRGGTLKGEHDLGALAGMVEIAWMHFSVVVEPISHLLDVRWHV